MTHISELVKSEISDFCAGLESPGCPETPEEIQRQLMDRILPLIKDARREWMARGVCLLGQELANRIERGEDDACLSFSRSTAIGFAAKIRAGEVY